jgi:cyclase
MQTTRNGVATELNLFDWAVEVAERGAGEILFTSMDNDGKKRFCK